MGMIVLGIIFIIGGAISFIYGSSMNNSYEAQWNSFFRSGTKDPGSMFVVIGAFAVILGVIFVVIGIVMYNNKKGNYVKNNGYMNQFESKNNNQINQLIELKNKGLITEEVFKAALQKSINQKSSYSTELWTCPKCYTDNISSVKFCINCGNSKPRNPSSYKLTPSSSEWQCPKCGRINQNYVGTCGCGAKKP